MKTTLIMTIFGILSFSTMASERVLLTDSLKTTAEINHSTLRCSARGYGLSELKINIKALDGWTILDHSNAAFGEFNGQPCMTAGACKVFNNKTGFDLEEILKTSPEKVKVVINREIKEIKALENNETNEQVCRRTIVESLETTINNIPFHHQRSISQDFDSKLCLE